MLETLLIALIVAAAAAQVVRIFLPRQWARLLKGIGAAPRQEDHASPAAASGCASGCSGCAGCAAPSKVKSFAAPREPSETSL